MLSNCLPASDDAAIKVATRRFTTFALGGSRSPLSTFHHESERILAKNHRPRALTGAACSNSSTAESLMLLAQRFSSIGP